MRVFPAIFVRRKTSPQDGFDSQHVDVIAADEFAIGDLRVGASAGIALLVAPDSSRSVPRREQPGQSLVLIAQIDIVSVCYAAPGLALLLVLPERPDKLIRSFHRQRSKQ